MGWFSLPVTQVESKAAFYDSESAAAWLSAQPQANTSLMLAELVSQIQAFNGCYTAPRERFKTMEMLRETLFAVSADCQHRYENKPQPLLPAEQHAFDSVRQLWAACTLAYLHCLNACLERDQTIAHHGARVAHRVLSCLRMEQINCYLGGAELAENFWRNAHGVYGAAEQLGITRVPVTDRLLGERAESTVSDQYCMLVLQHLAWPYTLTRAQLLAVSRWFARWREQVAVLGAAAIGTGECSIAIDLAEDSPIHNRLAPPRAGRWLSVGQLLDKMRRRLRLLAGGESPENLKLGTGLSAAACTALLMALGERLQNPQAASPSASLEGSVAFAVAGLQSIHYLLGGKGLHDPGETTQLNAQQIAIFGHVVRAPEESLIDLDRPETWRVTREGSGELHLLRQAGNGESRLSLKALLAVQLPQPDHFRLATVSGLYTCRDGSLCLAATLLAGSPEALIAEVREKPSGKISRHPAFLLHAPDADRKISMIVPSGLPARALGIRFFKDREQTPLALSLADIIERGADHERWALSAA